MYIGRQRPLLAFGPVPNLITVHGVGLAPSVCHLAPMAHIKLPMTCPNCQAKGYVTWQAEGLDRARWELLETSPGFHEEPSRAVRGRSVIVCNACDEILPD